MLMPGVPSGYTFVHTDNRVDSGDTGILDMVAERYA